MKLSKFLIVGGLTVGLLGGFATPASAEGSGGNGGPPDLCNIIPFPLPQCDDPEPGPPGPQGPQGDPGPQGEKGDKGDRGPRGWPGNDGAPGENGSDGLTPVAICTADGGIYFVTEEPEELPEGSFYPNAEFPCYGPQGPQGEPGADGSDGTPGNDGESVTGPQGPSGVDGKNGVDGLNGADGVTSHTSKVIVKTAEVAGETITEPAPQATPISELPATGTNWTWTLLFLGAALFAGGATLRYTLKK